VKSKTKMNKERFAAYMKIVKLERDEFRDQNFQFAKVIEFYSLTPDDGSLAKEVLKAWKARLEQPIYAHPLADKVSKEELVKKSMVNL